MSMIVLKWEFLNEDPVVMARRTALAKRLELYRSAPAEIEEGVLLESLVQSFKRVQGTVAVEILLSN